MVLRCLGLIIAFVGSIHSAWASEISEAHGGTRSWSFGAGTECVTWNNAPAMAQCGLATRFGLSDRPYGWEHGRANGFVVEILGRHFEEDDLRVENGQRLRLGRELVATKGFIGFDRLLSDFGRYRFVGLAGLQVDWEKFSAGTLGTNFRSAGELSRFGVGPVAGISLQYLASSRTTLEVGSRFYVAAAHHDNSIRGSIWGDDFSFAQTFLDFSGGAALEAYLHFTPASSPGSVFSIGVSVAKDWNSLAVREGCSDGGGIEFCSVGGSIDQWRITPMMKVLLSIN